MNDLSVIEMEVKLLEDSRLKAIRRQLYGHIPKIDFSIWEDPVRQNRWKSVEILSAYLEKPMIEHTFDDLETRTRWIEAMKKEYTWFNSYYRHNCLNIEWFDDIHEAMQNISAGYVGTNAREFEGLVQEVVKKTNITERKYDLMQTQQKMNLVREVKEDVYSILKFLAKQIPAQKESLAYLV